jgi:ribosomal protein S18 acetylase RimI-like enzyme
MSDQFSTMVVGDTVLTVRPIMLGDVDRLARFGARLSPESVRFRFFSPLRTFPRSMLVRLADVDHTCRDALVALNGDEIVAVARYDARSDGHTAEIALTVEDAWQHQGVGKRLARRLAVLARERGYDAFMASALPENRAALGLVHRLSPGAKVVWAGGDYEACMPIEQLAG